MIFDTHAHYTSHRFDGHRDEVLDSLPAQGVCGVVECGVDLATSRAALALAETRPWVWAAAGVHPESLIEDDASTVYEFHGDWRAELAAIEPLYGDPRVVAVGECGLDHHWPVPEDAQLALFEAELAASQEHSLPILVHDREAHAETYALLKRYRPRGILHAFSGSADDALWIARQGMLLGFGGALTFKKCAPRRGGGGCAQPGKYRAGNGLPLHGAGTVPGKRMPFRHDPLHRPESGGHQAGAFGGSAAYNRTERPRAAGRINGPAHRSAAQKQKAPALPS
ncbi:TatD family hydrolase [Ruthenibacterium lactatiformans]|uniref:TatD family hydrolase n=1 Tax=Ruthenibacterium lactatiformans TaxID=1550024 RepID=UPI000A9A84EC